MDDTTRGLGPGDDLRGRSEETARDYASPSSRPVSPSARPRADAGADDDLDADTTRRTREIEGEIAHTRAEMSETIDALQERLRPASLAAEAKERVKSATTEKVKSMAETASETAQEMMRGTRDRAYDVVESTRRNPVPALMIGAGVAWLLIDRNRRGDGRRERAEWSDYGSRRYGSAGRSDDYYRSSRYGEGEGWRSHSSGMGAWTREAGDEARQTVRRAQNGLQRLMRQNPLLVGAAAMLAGAAIGATLPETETENEWMGETRDTVVERAQEAAQNAATAVKEAANETVGETVSKVADKITK